MKKSAEAVITIAVDTVEWFFGSMVLANSIITNSSICHLEYFFQKFVDIFLALGTLRNLVQKGIGYGANNTSTYALKICMISYGIA